MSDLDLKKVLPNYFSEEELSCPCCGVNGTKPASVARLNLLRGELGYALTLNSAYRCELYNDERGFTQTHATGQAFDLRVRGLSAFKVLKIALALGFTGIGVKQKGSARFIHLDDLGEVFKRPRPWIWSY